MPLVEIYRSYLAADCNERALLLYTVGIESEVIQQDHGFAVFVDEHLAAAAMEHLRREHEENLAAVPSIPLTQLHDNAFLAVIGYVTTLLSVAYLASRHAFKADWLAAGALQQSAIKGEWWRLITALTLHVDGVHLLANLGFGALFFYFAGQLLGPGIAVSTIFFAAVAGNFLDALVMPSQQTTIGASTAVFAALGLVAAYSWRQQAASHLRWAHRWAPLIMGVVLLAMLGSGGEHTDVIAHLTGFIAGICAGALHAHKQASKINNSLKQLIAGCIALIALMSAWFLALIAPA